MDDSDLATSLVTRTPYSGFSFSLNHSTIYWKSSQQNLTAPPSTEPECLARSR